MTSTILYGPMYLGWSFFDGCLAVDASLIWFASRRTFSPFLNRSVLLSLFAYFSCHAFAKANVSWALLVRFPIEVRKSSVDRTLLLLGLKRSAGVAASCPEFI